MSIAVRAMLFVDVVSAESECSEVHCQIACQRSHCFRPGPRSRRSDRNQHHIYVLVQQLRRYHKVHLDLGGRPYMNAVSNDQDHLLGHMRRALSVAVY